jgi:hypothetical protein
MLPVAAAWANALLVIAVNKQTRTASQSAMARMAAKIEEPGDTEASASLTSEVVMSEKLSVGFA